MLSAFEIDRRSSASGPVSVSSPALLTGFLPEIARTATLRGFLKSFEGDDEVVDVCEAEYGGTGAAEFSGTSSGMRAVSMPLKTFIRAFRQPDGDSIPQDRALYLSQLRVDDAEWARPLLAALPTPEQLVDCAHRSTNLWMCVHDSVTNTHYDDDDNVLVVLSGGKDVALASPSLCLHPELLSNPSAEAQTAPPIVGGSIAGDGFHHAPTVDLFALHEAATAARRDAGTRDVCSGEGVSELVVGSVHCAVAHLGPGDALWLPAGWWHHVRSAPRTVAVNYWFEPGALQGALGQRRGTIQLPAAALTADPSTREASLGALELEAQPQPLLHEQWPFAVRKLLAAGLGHAQASARREWIHACTGARVVSPAERQSMVAQLAGLLADVRATPCAAGTLRGPPVGPSAADALLCCSDAHAALQALAELCGTVDHGRFAALMMGVSSRTWELLSSRWESDPTPEHSADAEVPGAAGSAVPALSSSADGCSAEHAMRAAFMSVNDALLPYAAQVAARFEVMLTEAPSATRTPTMTTTPRACTVPAAYFAHAPMSALIEASREAVGRQCLQRLLSGLCGVPVVV
jgi:hypothetical protein